MNANQWFNLWDSSATLIKEKSHFQGGLSTRNEMCLSYLLYYPRINLTRCASIPDIMEQLQFIGVKEIYRPVRCVKSLSIYAAPLFLSVGFLDHFYTTFFLVERKETWSLGTLLLVNMLCCQFSC